jgi:hypothetical protein
MRVVMNRFSTVGVVLLGLVATAHAAQPRASTAFVAYRAHVINRMAERERQIRATKLTSANQFGPETDQLLSVALAYNAMYAAPDAGVEVARIGDRRLELGSSQLVTRGKDGEPRPASLHDLAEAGITTHGEAYAALAGALRTSLARRDFRVQDDSELIETVERAIAHGSAQVEHLAQHPDIRRLMVQRRRAGHARAIELLDSASDLSIKLDKDGALRLRFGSARRLPSAGELEWLGLTSDGAISRLLGRRLKGAAATPKPSLEALRAELDSHPQRSTKQARASATSSTHKDKFDRFLLAPENDPDFQLLNELRGRLRQKELTVFSRNDFDLKIVGERAGLGRAHFELASTASWPPFHDAQPFAGQLMYFLRIKSAAQLAQHIREAILRADLTAL